MPPLVGRAAVRGDVDITSCPYRAQLWRWIHHDSLIVFGKVLGIGPEDHVRSKRPAAAWGHGNSSSRNPAVRILETGCEVRPSWS
jgi:hypothetical protein